MDIHHNIAESRFEVASGTALAVCAYRRNGPIWELHHTFVPDHLRGMGIAAALVRAALEHVKAQGGTVIPTCSYVATYLQRHPAFRSLTESRPTAPGSCG